VTVLVPSAYLEFVTVFLFPNVCTWIGTFFRTHLLTIVVFAFTLACACLHGVVRTTVVFLVLVGARAHVRVVRTSLVGFTPFLIEESVTGNIAIVTRADSVVVDTALLGAVFLLKVSVARDLLSLLDAHVELLVPAAATVLETRFVFVEGGTGEHDVSVVACGSWCIPLAVTAAHLFVEVLLTWNLLSHLVADMRPFVKLTTLLLLAGDVTEVFVAIHWLKVEIVFAVVEFCIPPASLLRGTTFGVDMGTAWDRIIRTKTSLRFLNPETPFAGVGAPINRVVFVAIELISLGVARHRVFIPVASSV